MKRPGHVEKKKDQETDQRKQEKAIRKQRENLLEGAAHYPLSLFNFYYE